MLCLWVHQSSSTAPLPVPTLATLSRLHIHFLLSFPFEALAMNYEPSGSMDSTLAHIYSRFIEQRRGGGYCLQVNVLYREMLARLGFRFLGVLGRVYSPVTNDWTGLTHTASLVYLPSHVREDHGKGVCYLSDVGFGSSPHRPILLRDAWEEFGRGHDKYRLIKSSLQPRSSLEPSPAHPMGRTRMTKWLLWHRASLSGGYKTRRTASRSGKTATRSPSPNASMQTIRRRTRQHPTMPLCRSPP